MKEILGYLKGYAAPIRLLPFLVAVCFIAIAIFCNYYFKLHVLLNLKQPPVRYLGWFLIFFVAFFFGYLIQYHQKDYLRNHRFLFLLFFAPALFAWKMTGDVHMRLSANDDMNEFWNLVLYWPLKLAVVLFALFLVWVFYDRNRQPFYGFSTKAFHFKPYGTMLLIMIPLIAAAATQKDFLSMYPKLQHVQNLPETLWYHKLLFEFSYGLDFISIEAFFRGFLVLAFCKWAGKDVILPMALFYCTIHFGKPVGECISSFFGGLILGVVTYHTGTIYGGLMVHLGIAWLMELGGYLGNQWN